MSTVEETLDAALERRFVFRDRPASAPSDLRPVWRVPVVILLISSCRGNRATHEQLHVLNWALRSAASAEKLRAYLAGETPPDRAIIRMEPALDRAIALAAGYELAAWSAKYWNLTPAGRGLLEAINGDEELLAREKEVLSGLPKPLTKSAVAALLKRDTR